MAKSKIARRYKKKSNPSAATELATTIGAGFAGYAATRFFSRMVYSQVIKKFPKGARHAGVIASAAGAAAAFFGSKHWDKAKDHHDAITIGAGIAVLQAAIQTYLPKYGWIVSDMDPSQYGDKKKAVTTADITALPSDADIGVGDSFDLEQLLAENSEIEAVPIGRAPPAELPASEPGVVEMPPMAGVEADGDPMEHFNGMLN